MFATIKKAIKNEIKRERLSFLYDTDESLSKDWWVSGYGVANRTAKSYMDDPKVKLQLKKMAENNDE